MLVLDRKPNESIIIGDDIVATVLEIRDGHVKIGIEAPPHVQVDRVEVRRQKVAKLLERDA